MQNFIILCPRVNVSLDLCCYILFRSLLRHCCCYLLSKVVRKPTLHCQGCVAIIPCLSKSRIIARHNSCRYKSPAPFTPTPHILGQVYARKLTQAWQTDEGEDCDWGIQALVLLFTPQITLLPDITKLCKCFQNTLNSAEEVIENLLPMLSVPLFSFEFHYNTFSPGMHEKSKESIQYLLNIRLSQ